LSRFTQWDFLTLIDKYQIPFHERSHGQLFCNDSAKDILNMLLSECEHVGVKIKLNTKIKKVDKTGDGEFQVKTENNTYKSNSLVIASGGLSIPKMCASPFGYKIAEQFGLNIIPTSAGLVPFTLQPEDKTRFEVLSGIAIDSVVSCNQQSFRENILFTHRGLSGPAILQISSYWKPADIVSIDLLPDTDLFNELNRARDESPQRQLSSVLVKYLPKRLVQVFITEALLTRSLQSLSQKEIIEMSQTLKSWEIKPNGTEGYRTAEVTLGGVDCNEISSKTLETKKVPGLYFIGEVLDVSGWLGGYNFQWAWSSGWCAGQYV
jgi:predicted Rossmann fold flavoprotein